MTDRIVIRAEDLGKKYSLGHEKERVRYRALRDVLVQAASGALRKTKMLAQGADSVQAKSEEFWALKDVSFELRSGEVLGIIGRNGAGKSTLLKILSRITEPSAGRVTIQGRVASLLEVGTGFHPELTGRENIFLNGAVLGMKRAEIKRKFDEIVGFAEVEKFLDTPVKRYSSGMYVRLAFAVAAHLEPEILIVDEVLAVGDAEFQKKCLNKMSEVASGGRTVLFVSHNLSAIADLCTRALLLQKGQIQCAGTPEEVISAYIEQSNANLLGGLVRHAVGDITVQLELSTNSGNNIHHSGSPLELTLACSASRTIRLDEFCLTVETVRGQRVGLIDFRLADDRIVLSPTITTYVASLANSDLVPGTYVVKTWMSGSDIGEEFELGTIEFVETARNDRLSLFPPHVNGIMNFRGRVEKRQSNQVAASK
jgi:ABC-type polysaccharide/polyol phosphate transport system ATPase subunit